MVKRRGPAAPVDPERERERERGRGREGGSDSEYVMVRLTLKSLEAIQRNSTRASHKLEKTSSLLIIIRLHCLRDDVMVM